MSQSRFDRRSFLRTVGVATGGTLVASTGASASGTGAGDGQYERVVDIVEDYGADPTGTDPVNDAFEAAVGKDTKIIFPDGVYLFDRISRFYEAENTAVVGEKGSRPVMTVPDGYSYYTISMRGTGIHFENFTVDYSAAETTAALAFQSDDEFVLRDVDFKGVRDVGKPAASCFLAAVTDPDGFGVVEDVHAPDGSADYLSGSLTFIYNSHSGTLKFRRCSAEGMSGNAIYASGAGQIERGGGGPVQVENCFFRNNNIASVRLGTPGSYVENCTIVVDGDGPAKRYEGSIGNARAIWCYYNMEGYVKNCDIVLDHPAANGIVYKSDYDRPSKCDVYNTRIHVGPNADGIEAIQVNGAGEDLEFKDVSITGDAADESAVRLLNRDATFENCCIEQTGESRDGFDLDGSTVVVRNTSLDVTGEEFDADDESSYETSGLRQAGGCAPAQSTAPWEQS